MNSAGKEWAAYVARRNEIETAKARRAGTPASPRLVPLSAGVGNGGMDAAAQNGGAK